MRTSLLISAAVATALTATPVSAATKIVDFSFEDAGGVELAGGSFSYDASKTGQLDYTDLDSFEFIFPTNTYDLAFLNSGDFTIFYYFGFNADTNAFVTTNIGGFPQILSGIKNGFGSGFFVRQDDRSNAVRDYGFGGNSFSYASLAIDVRTVESAVPEPETWLMLLLGFFFAGSAIRTRKSKPNVELSYS